MKNPIILTIAGSDSSGGAGIQADLKTFASLNAHGCCVITAITAQNTQGIQVVKYLSPTLIIKQCESVFADFQVQAIKIGVLGNAKIIIALANFLQNLAQIPPLIIDPIITSSSNFALINENAINYLVDKLFPLATIITPNLYEGAKLLQQSIPLNTEEMLNIVIKLLDFGSQGVLLKAGHLPNKVIRTNLYAYDNEILYVNMPYIDNNVHGTGCMLSSAIATFIGHQYSPKTAIIKAINYVHQGIGQAELLSLHHKHAMLTAKS